MLSPVGSVIMMRAIDRRDLIRMTNLFSAPMLIAPVLGPPIGGLITTYLGWPWIFYLNLPVGVAGALLALRFIPAQPTARRPFDARGFALNGGALATLIWGFGALGGRASSLSYAIGVILAGVTLAALAVRHALRHPLSLIHI